jgi:hypothetical protein
MHKYICIKGWVDNIKMDLRRIGWVGVNWTDMAQRALVNIAMNL